MVTHVNKASMTLSYSEKFFVLLPPFFNPRSEIAEFISRSSCGRGTKLEDSILRSLNSMNPADFSSDPLLTLTGTRTI